jgi:2-haloacid dehalogenase
MPKPTAVVFDLGGVLIDWNPRYLYRSIFGDDVAGMEWFLANVTTHAWNEQQDRGRPWAEAIDALIAEHPDRAHLIRPYNERWTETLGGAFDGTVELLAELKVAGVRLYALTNWSGEKFDVSRERFPFLDWFEGILVSGHERMAKPDEEIFRLLFKRFSLVPESTVFIDDNPPNVAQARRLGMDAIHFTSAAALRTELEQRGLLG